MQHGKGTNNFRNRHYPPLPIYGTFRRSPLTIRIILFLLTKHPTKIIVLWLNDERSDLPTHYKKLPVAPEPSAMSSQFRFTKLISYTCEKGETDEQVLSSSFPSEQEQTPLSEHSIALFHVRLTPYYIRTHPFRNKESLPLNKGIYLSRETYIPIVRDLYTFHLKRIYLWAER